MKTDFTRAQVKALLLVASTSKRRTASPYADLLATAIDSTTPVAELARIKEQAKTGNGGQEICPPPGGSSWLYPTDESQSILNYQLPVTP